MWSHVAISSPPKRFIDNLLIAFGLRNLFIRPHSRVDWDNSATRRQLKTDPAARGPLPAGLAVFADLVVVVGHILLGVAHPKEPDSARQTFDFAKMGLAETPKRVSASVVIASHRIEVAKRLERWMQMPSQYRFGSNRFTRSSPEKQARRTPCCKFFDDFRNPRVEVDLPVRTLGFQAILDLAVESFLVDSERTKILRKVL